MLVDAQSQTPRGQIAEKEAPPGATGIADETWDIYDDGFVGDIIEPVTRHAEKVNALGGIVLVEASRNDSSYDAKMPDEEDSEQTGTKVAPANSASGKNVGVIDATEGAKPQPEPESEPATGKPREHTGQPASMAQDDHTVDTPQAGTRNTYDGPGLPDSAGYLENTDNESVYKTTGVQNDNTETTGSDIAATSPEKHRNIEVDETATFVGKNGNGIPEFIFGPEDYEGPVTAASGSQFRCRVTDNWIEISDGMEPGASPSDSDYYFIAYVNTHDGTNSLGVSVRSEVDGKRHPDLYAGKLLAQSVEHFEGRMGQGKKIPYITGNWSTYREANGRTRTDNLDMYRAHLAALGPGPYTHEQRAAAASGTKTGNMAHLAGFSYVDGNHIEDHGDNVVVQFWRPEEYRRAHPDS
jgi:hypothetical protein